MLKNTLSNLSRPLGLSSPKMGQGSVRTQNFSDSRGQLQQYKDREGARISMHQAYRSKYGGGAVTSIGHTGKPSTSAGRVAGAKSSVNDPSYEANYDEGADERRYAHIQRLIRARKSKEAKSAGSDLEVRTGAAFSQKGLKKSLNKLISGKRNIAKSDKDFFENLVAKKAKAKLTGSGFGYRDKVDMKLEVERAKQRGGISYEDAQDFKGMVDEL